MDKVCLRFYMHESEKCRLLSQYEWLLVLANRLGIPAGMAMRAIAGYDPRTVSSTHRVKELAADPTVTVEFIVSETEAEKLVAMVAAEGVCLPYTRHPVECRTTEATA